jgi:hypothetical protein
MNAYCNVNENKIINIDGMLNKIKSIIIINVIQKKYLHCLCGRPLHILVIFDLNMIMPWYHQTNDNLNHWVKRNIILVFCKRY